MSRIVYSTSLRSHLKHSLGRKPFYRRPAPWALVTLANLSLALCLYGKVPLDAMWGVLPQAKATQRPSLSAEAPLPDASTAKASVKVEPPIKARDPRQGRVAAFIAKRYRIAQEAAEHITQEAFKAGKAHNVDPLLVLAIVGVESRFNPLAESSVGAMGLMQALPEFHPDKMALIAKREGHILNIADNIELGARIYGEYQARFKGQPELALQQYNGSLDDPSRAYSRKVLELRSLFAKGSA